jgi:enoyl-CoA hydratase
VSEHAADDTVLIVEQSDRVAVITLNRPKARNAMNKELQDALVAEVQRLEGDDDVDVVVLTGSDPAFCAGFDLTRLADSSALEEGLYPWRGPFPPRHKLLIGAVNGPAVTGGLELALACDFIVASEHARFADTHAKVGVMPGWGLTVLLPERVGFARAREMSASGRFVDAHLALTWGLVNHVVPHEDLLRFTIELAHGCVSAGSAVGQVLDTYSRIQDAASDVGWRIEGEARQRWQQEHFRPDTDGSRLRDVMQHGREELSKRASTSHP